MKKKRLIIASAVLAVVIITAGLLIYINWNAIVLKYCRAQYAQYKVQEEKYVILFKSNREDFEYVADHLSQYPSHSSIFFSDSVSCNTRELDIDLKYGNRFKDPVMRIYAMNAFDSITVYGDEVVFKLSNPPKDCYGYLCYYKEVPKAYIDLECVIDGHWVLWIEGNR